MKTILTIIWLSILPGGAPVANVELEYSTRDECRSTMAHIDYALRDAPWRSRVILRCNTPWPRELEAVAPLAERE